MAQTKPLYPKINGGHPLARGLIFVQPTFERGGTTTRELVSQIAGSLTNSPPWVTSLNGTALSFNGAASAGPYTNTAVSSSIPAITQMSFFCLAVRKGNGGGSNARLFSESDGTNIGHNINDTTSLTQFTAIWSTTAGVWTFGLLSNNVYHSLIITYDGSSVNNNPLIWVDGLPQTVTKAVPPVGNLTTNRFTNLFLGNSGGSSTFGTRTWNGYVSDFYKWNRLLNTQEVKQLSSNPFAFYQKRSLNLP